MSSLAVAMDAFNYVFIEAIFGAMLYYNLQKGKSQEVRINQGKLNRAANMIFLIYKE
jgi:hypothetical protein